MFAWYYHEVAAEGRRERRSRLSWVDFIRFLRQNRFEYLSSYEIQFGINFAKRKML